MPTSTFPSLKVPIWDFIIYEWVSEQVVSTQSCDACPRLVVIKVQSLNLLNLMYLSIHQSIEIEEP